MLRKEAVKAHFLSAVGDKEITPYLTYIDIATAETERLLRPEFAENPPGVTECFAAALALRLYVNVRCTDAGALCTDAGVTEAPLDRLPQLSAAERMLSAYRALCSPFLRDEAFVILGVRPKQYEKKEVTGDAQGNLAGDAGETTGGSPI